MGTNVIPNKLKEELEDVGKVYNSRSGMCVYPNAFSRLQTEIVKVCNVNKELEQQNKNLKARLNAINLLTPELEKSSKLKTQQLTKVKYTLKKIIETVQNDRIDEYGARLVLIKDFAYECLQEIEK